MVDFTRYQPPGIYTQAIPGPQIPIQAATPTAVGIFGLSQGFQTDTQSLTIVADIDSTHPGVNAALRNMGVNPASVVVTNPYTGITYVAGTDYTVFEVSPGSGSTTATYTIERVIGGNITVAQVVQVSYQYTNPNYFTPFTFYDYADVQATYGKPFDALGNVTSELTLACRFAFLNGAQRVVTAAVNPAVPNSPTLADYTNALTQLDNQPDVSVIVPATGMQTLQSVVQQHVDQQSLIQFERRAILGMDGTVNPVPSSTRTAAAAAINDARLALVSPATFNYFSPEANKQVVLGGQFMAAALAGIVVSNSPAQPLTREVVKGFVSVAENVAVPNRNTESQSGLMVVETSRRGQVQVRHGVTTQPGSIFTREWSITGQQDAMIYRVRAYLEADSLIGGIINDLILVNIKASADAALQSLVSDGSIAGYAGLKVRQLTTEPDSIEVSFEWQASMPLNYLVVSYSISVTSGTITALGNESNSTSTPPTLSGQSSV